MSDESLKFKAIQFMYRFKVEFAKTYMNGDDFNTSDTNLGEELTDNIENLTYDMVEKSLTLLVHETSSFDVVDCISHMPKDVNVRLNCLDNKGNTLKSVVFNLGELVGHQCKYDYASDEIVKHTLMFEFKNVKIV